jgi:hypothetical protein
MCAAVASLVSVVDAERILHRRPETAFEEIGSSRAWRTVMDQNRT